MVTIQLLPIFHRQGEQILLRYPNLGHLNMATKKMAGVKWSQTQKGWYLPLSKKSYDDISAVFSSTAVLDTTLLKEYLEKRKIARSIHVRTPTSTELPISPPLLPRQISGSRPVKIPAAIRLEHANLLALEKMNDHLKLKAYSESTKRTYLNEMGVFLQLLGKHEAEKLSTEDVKRYLLKCIADGLSENTIHSRINGLKFFYEQVLGREKFFVEIPRPKKPQLLPKVFNQDEIAAIINACTNLKHKVMLMLAYSGGLRVSEVVALKTMDIDSKRMTILLERAKGKKDRMVALSPVLLVMLREYWNVYKPSSKGYLFPGQFANEPYSTRSLQLVLQAAKEKAQVLRPGSIHALRHSFATHLLDTGTDVTMIMKLLGHNDLKTTLRYLHVTNRDVLKIISPLDNLSLTPK